MTDRVIDDQQPIRQNICWILQQHHTDIPKNVSVSGLEFEEDDNGDNNKQDHNLDLCRLSHSRSGVSANGAENTYNNLNDDVDENNEIGKQTKSSTSAI